MHLGEAVELVNRLICCCVAPLVTDADPDRMVLLGALVHRFLDSFLHVDTVGNLLEVGCLVPTEVFKFLDAVLLILCLLESLLVGICLLTIDCRPKVVCGHLGLDALVPRLVELEHRLVLLAAPRRLEEVSLVCLSLHLRGFPV